MPCSKPLNPGSTSGAPRTNTKLGPTGSRPGLQRTPARAGSKATNTLRRPSKGLIKLAGGQGSGELPALSEYVGAGAPMRVGRLLAEAPQCKHTNRCRPGLLPPVGRWSSHGTSPARAGAAVAA